MIITILSRGSVLDFLPKQGRVVEIGVAQGEFSRKILDRTNPRELHLIDPWTHIDSPAYSPDPNNVSQKDGERRYRFVCQTFAAETAAGRVHIHRALAEDVVNRFADGSLDWIYIDGNHTREAVARDLRLWMPKIAAGGLVLGHDYARHDAALSQNFGVVEAVNAFVQATKTAFLALTYEAYPTYVLARDARSPAATAFIDRLRVASPALMVVDEPWRKEFQHEIVHLPDGKMTVRLGFI